jgi:hypothetical protein
MSAKNKKAKLESISKNKNLIEVNFVVSCDDDFLVNGQDIYSTTVHFDKEKFSEYQILWAFLNFKFTSHPNNAYKIQNFKSFITKSLPQIKELISDYFSENGTYSLELGGNQTLKITLNKRVL